jgi:hypothetical protein
VRPVVTFAIQSSISADICEAVKPEHLESMAKRHTNPVFGYICAYLQVPAPISA